METASKQATFQELINSGKPVLADFSAEWCGPCQMMKPILEDLKKRVGEKATILKIDVDRNPVISSSYQIRSVPTLMLFIKGKVVWKQSGVIPAHELEQIITNHL